MSEAKQGGDAPRVHYTWTGPNAGQPFCNVDKRAAMLRGERFVHVPYSGAAEFHARPDLCPDCRAIWDGAE